ncbi:restriction endonuclease [candidate division KSB1 bacterium]|nr:restriction endonuclease [candidate division KSB1 bacterium]
MLLFRIFVFFEIFSQFSEISEEFKVQRTPPTRDGGYDFIAHTENVFGNPEKVIIESKFYKNQKDLPQ